MQQQHRHRTVLQLKQLGGGTRRVGAIPWLRGFSSSASSSSSATTTDGGQAEAASALDEPEAVQERRGTWVIKGLVLAMLTYIGMNVVPLMGESMVRQSLALVRVKDPFFKRSGASRLSQIATDGVLCFLPIDYYHCFPYCSVLQLPHVKLTTVETWATTKYISFGVYCIIYSSAPTVRC
jgi:hypothetical protein